VEEAVAGGLELAGGGGDVVDIRRGGAASPWRVASPGRGGHEPLDPLPAQTRRRGGTPRERRSGKQGRGSLDPSIEALRRQLAGRSLSGSRRGRASALHLSWPPRPPRAGRYPRRRLRARALARPALRAAAERRAAAVPRLDRPRADPALERRLRARALARPALRAAAERRAAAVPRLRVPVVPPRLVRRARARPPFLPPLLEADRLGFRPRPLPERLPPPSSLLTVAHARRAASPELTPRPSYESSMCSARRFCLLVYLALLPRGMVSSVVGPRELQGRGHSRA
jgi:hypothetical protein